MCGLTAKQSGGSCNEQSEQKRENEPKPEPEPEPEPESEPESEPYPKREAKQKLQIIVIRRKNNLAADSTK